MVTLAANTNYSAMTVANGDTIDLAGYRLKLDVNPSQTGVQVVSPGTAGKVSLGAPTNYPLSGWQFTAGTVPMITSIAVGTTFGGNITGGSAANAYGITVNQATLTGTVKGGAANGAHGVYVNRGPQLGNVIGGTASGAAGIYANEGICKGNITGGSISGACGMSINRCVVTGNVTGGSVSGAHGVSICIGIVIGAVTDTVALAVSTYASETTVLNGPLCAFVLPAQLKTVYSLFGPLNALSTVPIGTEVITLSGDTAAALRLGNRLAQRGAYL